MECGDLSPSQADGFQHDNGNDPRFALVQSSRWQILRINLHKLELSPLSDQRQGL